MKSNSRAARSAATLSSTVLSALTLAAVTGILVAAPVAQAQSVDPRPAYGAAVPQGAPMSFADLIESVSPAVVSIEVTGEVEVRMPTRNIPPQFREFFGPFGGQDGEPQTRERRAEGSGFFISADGLVVTNNHVVADADQISIVTSDGETLPASIVGTDPATDLAVLRVDGEEGSFPFVTLDEDPNVRVGDWVIAVGNPFGLGGTVTAGIISAKGRPLGAGSTYTDFLQIDAPINRGNSGGPAFDLEGNVIGVNSAIFSPSGGNVGIGFAIPSDLASDIVAQLVESGGVVRGYLGVGPQTLTPEIRDAMGIEGEIEGVLLSSVIVDTPAEAAGLEQGDIVIAVDGDPVTDARGLTRRIGAFPPGASVALAVLRDGEEQIITVTLAERPGQDDLAAAPSSGELFGMMMDSATDEARERLNLDEGRGVLVTGLRPGGEAAEKGIRVGDVILEAGGEDVVTPDDVRAAAEAARERGRSALLVLVATQGGARYLALQFTDDE
ncbi:MAG: Do family serine endopeptidase [Pseudomonadota bacterium]